MSKNIITKLAFLFGATLMAVFFVSIMRPVSTEAAGVLPFYEREIDGAAKPDLFGNHVTVDGDYAVFAAPGTDYVYVYKRNYSYWEPLKKIQNTDVGADTGFGNEVDISGDYMVVGESYGVRE
ncbi:hypothetical protein KKA95_05190, partial [Patescibacteria group bacterium]|nr:hypothetical protein [Patescibacteria group bacterium]